MEGTDRKNKKMTQGRYANIIIDISHEKVDRTFQYKIPKELEGKIEAGMCVQIPFGAGQVFFSARGYDYSFAAPPIS